MENQKQKKPFYKKWWVWLIAVIVVASIYNSGDSSETTESKITDEKATESTEVTKETKQEPAKKEEAKPAKEPTVVFENDKVKISFKEMTTAGVKYLVENKTDKALTVQAESIAVNGFSTNNILMSDSVASKSKGYVTAKTTELSEVGTPEKVSGTLRIIDMNSSNMETFEATFTDVAVQ